MEYRSRSNELLAMTRSTHGQMQLKQTCLKTFNPSSAETNANENSMISQLSTHEFERYINIPNPLKRMIALPKSHAKSKANAKAKAQSTQLSIRTMDSTMRNVEIA